MTTETTARHTPGPWFLDTWHMIPGNERGYLVGANGGKCIAETELAGQGQVGMTDEEIAANFRLIAAAPALLAALQMMERAFNVKTIDPLVAFMTIEKARAAIEQATGREVQA